MLTQDWMMRQIETLALAIAKIVFQKDGAEYRVTGPDGITEADQLYISMDLLMKEGRISEAEDLLFESLEDGSRDCMEVAVDFYFRVNMLTDQALADGNFSREEIEEGLHDVMDRFGIVLP